MQRRLLTLFHNVCKELNFWGGSWCYHSNAFHDHHKNPSLNAPRYPISTYTHGSTHHCYTSRQNLLMLRIRFLSAHWLLPTGRCNCPEPFWRVVTSPFGSEGPTLTEKCLAFCWGAPGVRKRSMDTHDRDLQPWTKVAVGSDCYKIRSSFPCLQKACSFKSRNSVWPVKKKSYEWLGLQAIHTISGVFWLEL